MSPAKKQTQTTEPKEEAVTDENTTTETTEQADAGTDSIPATLAEGEIVIAAADLNVITKEAPELTSFRAAAEFFKALDFEYEDTFDVHVDKSGIRAFVRHPQNGMRTAKFISFQEIPLVKRQAIVDEVNPKSEGEGE